MASLRKMLSKRTLGEQQSLPSKGSPRKLHKALSTTFNYLADTVRQGATYIYQEPKVEDLPQCSGGGSAEETPKKHRRRSSFFSSVRNRKGLYSPRRQNDEANIVSTPSTRKSESSESAPTLVRSRRSSECPTLVYVTDEVAPSLDVQIPVSSWPVDMMNGGGPSSPMTEQWTSSPFGTREDPFTSRDDLSARLRNLISSESPKLNTQYVEDTGYIAESESEAEHSGIEGLSPTYLERARSKERSLFPVTVPHRESSAIALKPASGSHVGTTQSQIGPNNGRLPSDVYEADAELSEPSPKNNPSMGSRTMFEQGLADRSRRYLAVIGHDTELKDNISTDPQFSPSLRLTNNEITALRVKSREVHVARGLSSNTDTDVSDSSPLKHATILTQEDAYGAGMRAAGIICSSCSTQPSPTLPEQVELSPSYTEAKSQVPTSISHWRTASNISDATSGSCAVTTISPSCDAPPPYPILHVQSEPPCQSSSTDISALNAAEKAEIAIAGPANIGFRPSSPATFGDKVGTNTPKSDPSFGSPSMDGSPQSKRALRQQRRANRKAAAAKSVEKHTMKSASPGELHPQPLFSIKQFEPEYGDPPPYAGHELDAVHNILQREMACSSHVREMKGVSFAENEEIIGRSVIVRRLSPGSSPL